MFHLVLIVVFASLAIGMLTNPIATIPFAIGASFLVSLFLLIRFFWPSKDNTKQESYAFMDLIKLISPW